MNIRRVAVQSIFRCKECGRNPEIRTAMEMMTAAWAPTLPAVASYSATVACNHGGNATIPLFLSGSPSYFGLKKSQALTFAISAWNQNYGKQ